MDFKSYKADQKVLYKHIEQFFNKVRTPRLLMLLETYDINELINDCWISIFDSEYSIWAIECRKKYNGSIVKTFEENRIVRQRVSVAAKNFISIKYQKEKRLNNMKKEYVQIEIEEVPVDWLEMMELKQLQEKAKIFKDSDIILKWKMDLLSDEEACEKLKCSRMTLFNRWNKIKEHLNAEDF